MEEILRFVTLARSDRFSVTDLCEQFGISRKTGYKHLERYAVLGLRWTPKTGQRGSLTPNRQENDPHVQEEEKIPQS
jgi:hypothetical protein